MVGEEKRRGAGASGSAGFQRPAVSRALAAEEETAPEQAEPTGKAEAAPCRARC